MGGFGTIRYNSQILTWTMVRCRARAAGASIAPCVDYVPARVSARLTARTRLIFCARDLSGAGDSGVRVPVPRNPTYPT